VFRRGLRLMRQFYKKKIYEPVHLAIEAAYWRFNNLYKIIG
jgi:hypothetical protein